MIVDCGLHRVRYVDDRRQGLTRLAGDVGVSGTLQLGIGSALGLCHDLILATGPPRRQSTTSLVTGPDGE